VDLEEDFEGTRASLAFVAIGGATHGWDLLVTFGSDQRLDYRIKLTNCQVKRGLIMFMRHIAKSDIYQS
jgi:hypothetical protein